MSVYPTTTTRCNIPDTVETVAYDETGDILLWVEDARPTVAPTWDAHAGAPSGELATEVARQRELPEVDFMNQVADSLRRNGCPGLHEDPNDTRLARLEARRPTF